MLVNSLGILILWFFKDIFKKWVYYIGLNHLIGFVSYFSWLFLYVYYIGLNHLIGFVSYFSWLFLYVYCIGLNHLIGSYFVGFLRYFFVIGLLYRLSPFSLQSDLH